MTWLTRMHVTVAAAREKRLTDIYAWHRLTWSCFPSDKCSSRPFLARINSNPTRYTVYLLSEHRKPEKPQWVSEIDWEVKELPAAFFDYDVYGFELRTSPMVCKCFSESLNLKRCSGIKCSKLQPIYGYVNLYRWLVHKGEISGFSIISVKIRDEGKCKFKRQKYVGWCRSVNFCGIIKVTERILFQKAFHQGIGRSKAFGFGMLLLKPLH